MKVFIAILIFHLLYIVIEKSMIQYDGYDEHFQEYAREQIRYVPVKEAKKYINESIEMRRGLYDADNPQDIIGSCRAYARSSK